MKVVIHPHEKAPKLFKNEFLNKLTVSNPILVFSIYFLISILLVFISSHSYHAPILEIVGFFIVGVFCWTLVEYLLHRFIYHKISDASYDTGLHYIFHGIHHGYPHDETKIVLPPVPSLIIASILFTLIYVLMGEHAFSFGPGFIMGYAGYMWIHYSVHAIPSPKKYNFWWRHHNVHHYQQHDKAFGVSTSIWDRVFRTMPKKNRRTIDIVTKKETKT